MGEVTDEILDGFVCQYCLCIIDDKGTGYPRTCAECQEDDDE